jgi:cytochrome c oxidase subunit 5a
VNTKYLNFFKDCKDDFELKRGLNNVFSYDMVPSAEVCREALKAARRVHDFPAAIRIFDAIKEKTTAQQYQAYLKELESTKKELGVLTKEELGL